MSSKVKIRIYKSQEYSLNLLRKHSLNLYHPYFSEEDLFITIRREDLMKTEKLLHDYGKEYEIIRYEDRLLNLKNIRKRIFYLMGVIVSVLSIFAYSTLVTSVEIRGTKELNEQVIKDSVAEELALPKMLARVELKELENKLLRMDGIASVSDSRLGKNVIVNVVEELPKTSIWDTKNFNIVSAKEGGSILKIVVYGGTCVVNVGDKVEKDAPLIMPYVGDGEVKRPSVAFGEITALVTREKTLTYNSEEEFETRSGQEITTLIDEIKASLSEHETFVSYRTIKKVVDKTIVCSIYYEIVTRIA